MREERKNVSTKIVHSLLACVPRNNLDSKGWLFVPTSNKWYSDSPTVLTVLSLLSSLSLLFWHYSSVLSLSFQLFSTRFYPFPTESGWTKWTSPLLNSRGTERWACIDPPQMLSVCVRMSVARKDVAHFQKLKLCWAKVRDDKFLKLSSHKLLSTLSLLHFRKVLSLSLFPPLSKSSLLAVTVIIRNRANQVKGNIEVQILENGKSNVSK